MNLVFFGDSITDGGRVRESKDPANPTVYGMGYVSAYGAGYVRDIVGYLSMKYPNKYNVYNRGVAGEEVVHINLRKEDVWALKPDVLTILVGVNDVNNRLRPDRLSGRTIELYESVYSSILEEARAKFPNITLYLMQPFTLNKSENDEKYEFMVEILKYGKVVEKLAKKYNATYIPLHDIINEYADKYGKEQVLADGIHPEIMGCKIIANEWIKHFEA